MPPDGLIYRCIENLIYERAARHEGKIETRNKDLKAETLRKQNLVEQVLLQNYNTYYLPDHDE